MDILPETNLGIALSGLTDTGFFVSHDPAKPLPVHNWNPPFCGHIDLCIQADGTWLYNGTAIRRPALVHLFARILRKDGDAYFLVTPVEKVGIRVEDVPLLAIEMNAVSEEGEQTIVFRSNVGDTVTASAVHPLRFATDPEIGFKPYIHMRDGLEARLTRSVAQELAALGTVSDHNGELWFGIQSAGVFFPIVAADTLETA